MRWADPYNPGFHYEEWAQEEIRAFQRLEEKLHHSPSLEGKYSEYGSLHGGER